MAFEQFKLDVATVQSRGIFNQYVYETDDLAAEVQVAGYFAQSRFAVTDPENWFGSFMTCKCSDQTFTGEISSGGTLTPVTDIPPVFPLTEGQVPKANNAGSLIYGGATVDPTTLEWTFDNSINLPAASLSLGEVVKISEGAGDLIITDAVQGTNSFSVNSVLLTTGSLTPAYGNYGAEAVQIQQPVFTQNLTTSPIIFQNTSTLPAGQISLTTDIRLKTFAPTTNFRIRVVDNASGTTIRYIPSKVAWDTGEGGLELGTGDITLDLMNEGTDTSNLFFLGVNPFVADSTSIFDIEVRATSMNLLGNVGGIPYLAFLEQQGVKTSLTPSPASSLAGHIASFDGTGGIQQVSDVFVRATSGTDDPVIEIQDSTGTPELAISADFDANTNAILSQSPMEISTASQILTLKAPVTGMVWDCSNVALSGQVMTIDNVTAGVGKLQFKDATNERGFIGYDVSANAIVVDSKQPGNTSTLIKSDNSVTLEYTSVSGFIALVSSGSSDLEEVFLAQNTGTNPGLVEFHVGGRDPNGNVNQNEGTVYYRSSGATSAVYLKTTPLASTVWEEFLHTGSSGVGDVDGPGSSIDGHITAFSGTTGKIIQQTEDVILRATGAATKPSFIFQSSAGTPTVEFDHDFSSGLTSLVSTDIMELATNGTNKNLDLITKTSGDIRLRLIGASDIIHAIGANADTAPLFKLDQLGSNGGTSEWTVGTRSPEGVVTANGGAIYIRDQSTLSDMYFKKTDGTNTNWRLNVLKSAASTTSDELATWDGDSSTIGTAAQWKASGNILEATASGAAVTSRLDFRNSSNAQVAKIDIDHSFSKVLHENPTGYDFNFLTVGGDIDFFTDDATGNILFQNIATPDTAAGFTFVQAGTNGGTIDLFTSTRPNPEGLISANGGALLAVDSATTPNLYQKVGDGTTADWFKFKREGDAGVTVTAISRSVIISGVGQSITVAPQPILGWVTQVANTDSARLDENIVASRIDVKQVSNSIGDLYRINFNATWRGTAGVRVDFDIVHLINGVSGGPIMSAQVVNVGSTENYVSISGVVRGPILITGITGFRVNFAGNTSGSLIWDILYLSVERIS